ncbi:hypothetical protein [Pedobacter polysacchareus]|uniref:hypothetical protein n=1 Tax=Pedobacter polysacchareus TaxID=2861973 RepID=UPI001C99572E|nr:hypothetical protein [Pedobacter polysacchareus]
MKSKAIFLLVIFLLNTLVGFGCALGMNANHHEAQGTQDRAQSHKHRHVHKTNTASGLSFSNEDLCCKILVDDLLIQSKLIPEISKLPVLTPMMLVSANAYDLFVAVSAVELNQSAEVNHRERPPNSDIRIIIQSFQI